MKRTPMSTTAVTTLAILLLAFSAGAREHRALNGTWTLQPAKSDFAGQPALVSGTVTINEREGNITIARNFVYEGAAETLFYSDITDGQNSATIRSGTAHSDEFLYRH